MAPINAKQVLNDLYGLLMEINLHRADEDILAELNQVPDAQIDKHLSKIKQLNTKLKAEHTKLRFLNIANKIKALGKKGLEELKQSIQPQEQARLVPLFRKFEELTKEDEDSILEDEELLHLIEILKDRIDENPE